MAHQAANRDRRRGAIQRSQRTADDDRVDPAYEWDRRTGPDPSDPRVAGPPCNGEHAELKRAANQWASYYSCPKCRLRLLYVPMQGAPGTHRAAGPLPLDVGAPAPPTNPPIPEEVPQGPFVAPMPKPRAKPVPKPKAKPIAAPPERAGNRGRPRPDPATSGTPEAEDWEHVGGTDSPDRAPTLQAENRSRPVNHG